jgi:hypothetical protein
VQLLRNAVSCPDQQYQTTAQHWGANETRVGNSTYVGDAQEREQEGGQNDTKREELPVPMQQLELVNESSDHGFHATHLQDTEHSARHHPGTSLVTQWGM